MNRLPRFLAALCLAIAFVVPASAQDAVDPTAAAAAVLDQMEAGDFEAATGDFNDQMKAALSATQLASLQLQIESAGPVQSRGDAQVSSRDGYTVVVHRIQREHAALDATVAIDAEGKVAGLHFAPAADTIAE